ncbi:hypothetical protein QEN19_000507 [Hanseniaspora menglaensis]
MTGQYLNVLINEKFVFPIKIFLNSSSILEEKNVQNDENNNIVINNDLFQLYKPNYKLIISNKDLEKLYLFLETDLKFVLTELFSNDENLRKLIRLKPLSKNENIADNFNLLLKDSIFLNSSFLHTDSLIKMGDIDLKFDKVYKLGKQAFVIKINSPIWNLTLLINDYSKFPTFDMKYIDVNDLSRDDLSVIKSKANLKPKVLIEESEESALMEEIQQELKPEFVYKYERLKFFESNDSIQIIIMNKKKK